MTVINIIIFKHAHKGCSYPPPPCMAMGTLSSWYGACDAMFKWVGTIPTVFDSWVAPFIFAVVTIEYMAGGTPGCP